MRTCRLFVSIEAIERHSGEPVQLCGGHKVTVTERIGAAGVLCVTERGEEVWIEETYVSHAA